jgi:hypothetical protein
LDAKPNKYLIVWLNIATNSFYPIDDWK